MTGHDALLVFGPVLLTFALAGVAALVKSAAVGIGRRIDQLESNLVRFAADVTHDDERLAERLDAMERHLSDKISRNEQRLTRLESWKEITELRE